MYNRSMTESIIKILREHAEQQDFPAHRCAPTLGEDCVNVDKCPHRESHWAETDYFFEQGFKLGVKIILECFANS